MQTIKDINSLDFNNSDEVCHMVRVWSEFDVDRNEFLKSRSNTTFCGLPVNKPLKPKPNKPVCKECSYKAGKG